MIFWIVAFLRFIFALATVVAGDKVTLRFRNDSEDWIGVHWMNPSGGTSVIKDNIEPKSVFTLNSFLAHKFEVRQLPDPATGICNNDDDDNGGQKSCKINYFQVTESPEQSFVITDGLEVESVTVTVASRNDKLYKLLDSIDLNTVEDPVNILAECKAKATKQLQQLEDGDDDTKIKKIIHDDLHDCVTFGLTPAIKASIDEVEFERSLRLEASNVAENFTCVNVGLETSPDVLTEEWVSPKDNVARTVHIKLNRPASRIHVIDQFASPDECDAMEKEAEKDLHVASTADGKGGSKVSINRKAMQAGIKPKFTEDGDPLDGNLIAVLSGRVYEYVNHVLDMNISHHGQEPLMSIQYFGRGKHDKEPDRYTPHCDGRCNGEGHIYGGRMATMVIYCTVPEKGGFTNFQNANVHVRPNPGSAVFFAYVDPLTNLTDNGLTQHSGCPVYEGEKKIITQWIRYGVNQKTPHSAYNTLTILTSEDGE